MRHQLIRLRIQKRVVRIRRKRQSLCRSYSKLGHRLPAVSSNSSRSVSNGVKQQSERSSVIPNSPNSPRIATATLHAIRAFSFQEAFMARTSDHFVQQFRAARRVSTPIVTVRTPDPESSLALMMGTLQ